MCERFFNELALFDFVEGKGAHGGAGGLDIPFRRIYHT